MNNERQFYVCTVCGNLIGKIEDSGVAIVCCGQEMTPLKDNTVDASHEKHVPVFEKGEEKITIKVGSIPHPMTKEHHIGWIVLKTNSITIRKKLSPGDEPEITLPILEEGKLTMFAWCNLHGLWSNEIQ